MSNPILDQAKAKFAAQAKDPRLAPVVAKLVAAGHQILFSPHTRGLLLKHLAQGHEDPEVIGAAIAHIGAVLYRESKKTAPLQALIPACFTLLCDLLQFIEDAGAIQVTAPVFAAMVKATGAAALQAMGIPAQKLGQMLAQKQGGAPTAPAAPAAPTIPAQPPAAPAAAGLVGGAMGGA